MREYLRGEKDVSDSYERRLINDIRERLAVGLSDLSLAAEHIDEIESEKILMRFQPGQPANGDLSNGRDGWRHLDLRESIVGSLTFLMELSRAFDFQPDRGEWQKWIGEAIQNVRDVEHVDVRIESYSTNRLDRLRAIFDESPQELDRETLGALLITDRITLDEYVDQTGEVGYRALIETPPSDFVDESDDGISPDRMALWLKAVADRVEEEGGDPGWLRAAAQAASEASPESIAEVNDQRRLLRSMERSEKPDSRERD